MTYAAVRIRGNINVNVNTRTTLEKLMLTTNNHCVLLPEKPELEGMLLKAASYITWGKVSEKTVEKLLVKRGRLAGDKKLDEKAAKEAAKKIAAGEDLKKLGIKKVFRLSPPKKGFKSVKGGQPKGDLGKRKEMDSLLEKMI